MKIFAIRDAADNTKKDLAYLLYYELDKRFYIELPENADPWETPLLLASFLRRGERTVNSYWSRLWVQQRRWHREILPMRFTTQDEMSSVIY